MAKKQKVNNSQYSSYWFDEDDYSVSNYQHSFDGTDLADDAEDAKLEAEQFRKAERMIELLKLGAFMRSCGNFVRILTGRDDINVRYEDGDNSYTDGKTVTLSSKVENNFDSTVGLALHEASHIVLTNFDLLKKLFEDPKVRKQYITDEMVQRVLKLNPKIEKWNWFKLFGKDKGSIYPMFHPNTGPARQAAEVFLVLQFKDVLNWVEDRRIDNYVYRSAPGYRGYYESLYNRYFLSDEITKDLEKNKTHNTETLDSYMYRLINMMNPACDMTVLKGGSAIKQTVNLSKIDRLTSTEQVAEVSKNILQTIMSNITALDYTQQKMQQFKLGNGDGSEDGMSVDLDSLTDEQCKEMFGMSKKQLEKLLDRMKDQRDFLRGDIKKKKLTRSDARQMNSLASAGVTMELAGGEEFLGQKIKVLMIEKLSDAVIDSDEFRSMFYREQITEADTYNWPHNEHTVPNAVKKGFVLGKMLGKRLQVRNEERNLKFTRQDKGKIDRRLISELGYDNANIFSRVEVNKYNKAHIHISVDASGSMSGERFFNAVKTAVATAVACDMVSNLECVISFRGTTQSFPLVCIAYDSRVNKLSHIRKFFPMIYAGGSTPESLCFEAMMYKTFPRMQNGEQFYFVNLSDGEPAYSGSGRGGESRFYYSGEPAYKHCKRMVNTMMREFGASIISYFISDYSDNEWHMDSFRQMYGNGNVFSINTDSVESIAKVMNGKFLQQGGTKNEGILY